MQVREQMQKSTVVLTSEAEARAAVEREVLLDRMMVREILTPRPLTISTTDDVRAVASGDL